MDDKDGAFLNKLMETFKVEAAEHLSAMSRGLLELEKSAGTEREAGLVERIFREAHSMKGAARSVNMADVESLCQSLENVFAAMKKKEIVLTGGHFDVLHQAVDFLGGLLSSLRQERTAEQKNVMKARTAELAEIAGGGWKPQAEKKYAPLRTDITPAEKRPEAAVPDGAGSPAPETVRISAEKLQTVLLQSEEFLSEKLAAGRRAADLGELRSVVEKREKELKKLRPNIRAAGRALEKMLKSDGAGLPLRDAAGLMKMIEFFEANYDFVTSLRARVASAEGAADRDRHAIGLMVDNLAETLKSVLMVPFSGLLDLLPKLVRDLSHAQGKEVELVVEGGGVEIDRRVLDEMKDPLIHLIRNCIDHGIEKPDRRKEKGKPGAGSVSISFSHAENKRVTITVSDDGAGIDFAKVRDSAVRAGVLSGEEAAGLDDERALRLIFESGVTTSPIITDLSGRGLGLAIVKENVDRLNGTVSCESRPGRGTTFRLELPLTLSAFRGVAVRVDEEIFIVPTINFERTVRVGRDEVRTVENRETIVLGGSTIPLVPLQSVLELPVKEQKGGGDDVVHVAVLAASGKRIAFGVDEVMNEEEVLVKGLGPQLSRVRNVSGATVLGNGRVVPVLNVSDLMKSAVGLEAAAPRAEKAPSGLRRKVLVVEDSITARTLLRNILEGAGYDVRTAVDGVDAFTQLKTEAADIVVSDVDMPRMNGFDLTAKIRSEKKFADLPVILVTALESREDRERGIDVGANAYIVKSSFDQSNLLEAMKRLL